MTSPATPATAVRHPGLTSEQVEQRRREFGHNVLTPPARDPWWKLFLEKFDDPVIRILMIAAVIAIGVGAVHGEYLEGIGIITAVLLATGLAFFNEYKANKEFDVLNTVNDDVPIKVVRDARFTDVPRKDIVVGDLVLIEAGEEVPADGTLLEAVSLQVNESGLTGESEPNVKVARDDPRKARLARTTYPRDMVLRGAMTLDGHGMYEVTAVGDATEIGKTVRAAAEQTGEATPLNQQLDKLSKVIGVVGLLVAVGTFLALIVRGVVIGELELSAAQWTVAGIFFVGTSVALLLVWLPMVYDGLELALGWEAPAWLGGDDDEGHAALRRWLTVLGLGALIVAVGLGGGYLLNFVPASPGDWLPDGAAQKFLTYFMIAVTIIVVAVPEGLAMSVTLSLAYSMRKMTAANTLVRRMHACETIGAATVICSDKTGTLTMNEMRVFAASYPGLQGPLDPAGELGALIVENIAANTTAHLAREGAEAARALGNPTEGALLFWLEEQGIDYVSNRVAFSITYQLTFSTERKWMGTYGVSPRTSQPCLHVKGAPELVLARCTQVRTAQGIEPIEAHREQIRGELVGFQARGMRTLGMAYHDKLAYDEGMDLEGAAHGLTWLGFLAIADPVRPEVPPAIQACQRAGIRVKMVTGDNPDTAQEIGRQIGLWNDQDADRCHLKGPDFQTLPDDQSHQAAGQLKILSRAKPLDKVRLVRSLQAQGEVVAVTGDGINDCGALNYADVGLAMGRAGKAAAKEASDIILLDDSFRTIVDAVMWGRSLYENIQRFILFQLTINVAALGIAFLGPFIGVELPLTVIQMLWVNLIMDTFAALALATEPPHRDVLNRPPRSPRAFIVTPVMATNVFGVAAVFLVILIAMLLRLQADGEVSPYELSVFFTVFVLLQFWNLFNARCLGLTHSAFSGVLQNKAFLVIAAAIFLGQVVIVQFGGNFFRTVPLEWRDWLLIVVSTSAVLWVGELWRLVRRLGRPARA
ncbi:MAG: calcium-translocating P-type ATPase, PMCA-type [Pirellulaceae bacterium]|nr:calcium-translocating P-type ATPase, PMCA-type [Pirellulaceae bacterium]